MNKYFCINSIITQLYNQSNQNNVAGMAHYGINPEHALGISIPILRKMAKEIGRNHSLAQELWDSGIHEARLLAVYITDPSQATEEQMESWVKDINSWDLCDGFCNNLMVRTPFAVQKAIEWSNRPETYVKRAAFSLMACIAVHHKQLPDQQFEAFLDLVYKQANDDRNFVKKAVNWALRQIGKRNTNLNQKAISMAKQIQRLDSKAARWIADDALRELTGEQVKNILIRKAGKQEKEK
ncbi:MAG: DNA alkylation repair protein [Anaerolineales bacterium]|nr:DNA alkylation repair protein [Anaerolineales bacterium]